VGRREESFGSVYWYEIEEFQKGCCACCRLAGFVLVSVGFGVWRAVEHSPLVERH
jgi:hypothetical protein